MVTDPRPKEICNEYATQTMFCQSQTYPTENKPFSIFRKNPEFQSLASKNLNWQPYHTRIENAHEVLYVRNLSIFCYV